MPERVAPSLRDVRDHRLRYGGRSLPRRSDPDRSLEDADVPRRLLPLLRDYAIPAVTVTGLVMFGVLRLAYLYFYLPLRATPEEVGYGYARVLSESVVGALELVLLVFLVLMSAALVVRTILATAGRRRGARRRPGSRAGPLSSRYPTARLAVIAFFVSVATVALSLPFLAAWQGRLARDGQTVRNVYFVGVPYLPILAVQAVPARVTWISPESDEQAELARESCLLYLGTSDGIAVFFDVRSHISLRLPASSIAISLQRAYFVPDECRAPS
jgi:hypothetical protein